MFKVTSGREYGYSAWYRYGFLKEEPLSYALERWIWGNRCPLPVTPPSCKVEDHLNIFPSGLPEPEGPQILRKTPDSGPCRCWPVLIQHPGDKSQV